MKGKNYCDLRWWQELLSGRRTFGDGTIPELPTKEPKMDISILRHDQEESARRIVKQQEQINRLTATLKILTRRERDRQWEELYKGDPSWIDAQERAKAFAEVMAAKAEEAKRLDLPLRLEDQDYYLGGYLRDGRKLTMALEYPCQVLIWDEDKVTYRAVLIAERPKHPYDVLTGPGCEQICPYDVISYRRITIEPQGSDV